ncbi:N-acetyl-gamma-glutamyl-phosphate reductase [Hippea alviniae]|uniref:N-acetyl-gamma-glutamyl-phosphate reductase n=1 Tax=Hippea alviniae TaxID=1279027 RepID=UPI0003B38292|nr:N-acetyl-gamma-glutamyl-phosphate reductase [Hippea alviniae]
MISVGIVGITGFTGLELIKILLSHTNVSIDYIASRSETGKKISDVYPEFVDVFEKEIEAIDIDKISQLDVVFLALPHTVSLNVAKQLKGNVRVIDLSADFRLKDISVYEKWYKVKHEAEELLESAVYGLPELNYEKVKTAKIVANPGCYATSVILGVAPVAEYAISVIADAKSGVSGAGRGLKEGLQFCEVNENFKAYSIEGHRHIPEMEQELSRFNENIRVMFIPHLLPIQRGILSTIYIDVKKEMDFKALYKDFYKDAPFVRVVDKPPTLNSVKGTNFCDIYVRFDERVKKLVVISVIDNLIKGASGQAVQNMNIMFNLNQKEGLILKPYYP